jgi:hypothetical protein
MDPARATAVLPPAIYGSSMRDGSEGWEWVRIQSDPCPQCGHDPARLRVDALGAATREAAADWRTFLESADTEQLRRSPAPDVWTPLQYAFHTRDMLVVFGERIELACREDDPAVPWFDPGEEAWRAYNEADPARAAAVIEQAAEGFGSTLGRLKEGDWSRSARRDGVDRFTVAGLACFGLHEAQHHLLDADGTLV